MIVLCFTGFNTSVPVADDFMPTTSELRCRSTGGGSLRDDISLYGTPKEEMAPLGNSVAFADTDARRPGWVRNQLQNIFQPTDNKLAMKLFGSKKALVKERVRIKAAGHWIIHPCSSFR
jgi:hypothetical protein